MATRKSSKFDVTIKSHTLSEAVRVANAKARIQAAQKPPKQFGAIFAQVFVTDDGHVRLKGDYIEPNYCDALQAVLNKRTFDGR